MPTYIYNVDGMHCDACEQLIKSEVEEIPGIKSVEVDREMGEVVVVSTKAVDEKLIIQKIEEAGDYQVEREDEEDDFEFDDDDVDEDEQ